MKPRRILTAEETATILDEAVGQSALAILSFYENEKWKIYKSRFLERDANHRFVVLDYQETHGIAPPELIPGQYVGLSFRYKSRKVMFATVVEAKGKYMIDGTGSVAAVRYRWPESMTELQRRAYYRTPVPSDVRLTASVWRGGGAARDAAQGDSLAIYTGEALDLSCGGALIKLNQLDAPRWADNETLGVELHLPDGQPPLLLDGHYRGARHDNANHLCAAVQFVGLELSCDSKAVLQRLTRVVQKFHRSALTNNLRDGRAQFRNG